MSKVEHETSSRRQALTCPACKRPVTMTTARGRHKTLGVFVPVWVPGPCHNPDCTAYLQAPRTT
ncbi:hypothetical protein ACWFQ8_28190 [Streptomyces sp. NPDC055254]